MGGTIAFIHGLSLPMTKRYVTTTVYVSAMMTNLRVQLPSHCLSASTRLFRSSIFAMRSSNS